jgi:hypothetical protein
MALGRLIAESTVSTPTPLFYRFITTASMMMCGWLARGPIRFLQKKKRTDKIDESKGRRLSRQ